jgi:hypothetical protein
MEKIMLQRGATVLDGQLKLDEPLDLLNQQRVTIFVHRADSELLGRDAWEAWKRHLEAKPIFACGAKFTRDELHERRGHKHCSWL